MKHIFRKLTAFFLAMLFVFSPFSALASEVNSDIVIEGTSTPVIVPSTGLKRGTTGDCTWWLDGTKLTISGTGAMADYIPNRGVDYWPETSAPWGTNVTEIIIEDGVTYIGAGS
ncbi:MAG: hypothetical protein IKU24_00575, partial [Clostridia bacterium]|nr:hypothetical protein [Clostridia bacterium]